MAKKRWLVTALVTAAIAGGCTGAIDPGFHAAPGDEASPPTQPRDTPSRPPASQGGGGVPVRPGAGAAERCRPSPVLTSRLPRLTRLQFENAVRDLTGLDVRPSRDLPPDPGFGGYDRSLVLEVGEVTGRLYRDQAESIARQLVADEKAFARVVGCGVDAAGACATTFIEAFGKRTFRRPLSEGERAAYSTLFDRGGELVESGTRIQKGVQVVVEAMLQSPSFLYRPELATGPSGTVALGSYEIASRLSFALANTTPDPELMAAADRGSLTDLEEIARHARRLVDSKAGRATLRDFVAQWLSLGSYANKLAKDPAKYPGVTNELAPLLEEEVQRFVETVTFEQNGGQGGGLEALLTTPMSYVNKVTAPLYGLKGAYGNDLVRADLDPTQRGGLLTQIGFLASNAHADRTDPIHRGVFVQRAILCTPLPSPQEQVPALPPSSVGRTTREIVDQHTSPAGCAACHHTLINPVGFAFEAYDPVGKWRVTDNGKPVDASGRLAGTAKASPFAGPVEAVRAIAESPEARHCYATNVLRYVFGRLEEESDRCLIETLADKLADDRYSARHLLVDLVTTSTFTSRLSEGSR